MASALKKQTDVGTKPGKHSFGKKLNAWWHGYELPPPEPVADTPVSDEPPRQAEADGSWSPARLILAQKVWGAGFLSPGGAEYIDDLLSNCPLTAADEVLEIGGGIGGTSRAIIEKFGSTVTTYKRTEALVDATAQMAEIFGIDGALTILETDDESFSDEPGMFRAALVRETFFRFNDKDALMGRIADALHKDDAWLIMTDYFRGDDFSGPELEQWRAHEDETLDPWDEEELKSCLTEHGFTIRSIEDDTVSFGAMARNGWADYMATLKGDNLTHQGGAELLREVELWTRRTAAMEAGALRHLRIEAVREE